MNRLSESTAGTARTEPFYPLLENLVKDVPGFSPPDQLYTLYLLAVASSSLPGDIVEIGSWGGRSAVALGLATQATGRGVVHCIDLFPRREDWYRNQDGTYSFRVTIEGKAIGAYESQRVWPEPYEKIIAPLYEKYAGILEIFEDTIARAGLKEVVKPYRGTGDSFFATTPASLRCRLAFIDGDHGYDAVCADIRSVHQRLVPGGWICFDDAFSGYEGVDRAINDLVIGNPKFDYMRQLTRKLFVARSVS